MAKYIYLLVLAFCLFSTQVYRPIDGSSRNIWREADMGSMARNYYEEGMNIFYPRIDWRGAGPGYVESEFPFEPWLGALLYQIFGYHEWLLRLISMITLLGSCVIFFLLANCLLSKKGAFLASLLFVLHPYIFLMSTSIQPEPMMLLGYLLAIYGFVRWIQTDRMLFYYIAFFATPFAILAKVPAAHVGILFALLSFDKYGLKALSSLKLWIFAFFSLGIPFLWYRYARSLWEIYGNSLGLSNEAFARIGTFSINEFIKVRILGNLYIELKKVWMGFGALLGIAGFFSFARKKEGKVLFFWGISLVIYYLVAGSTTGQDWASYYHIVSVPFACILMAEGVFYLRDIIFTSRKGKLLVSGILIGVICVEVGVFIWSNFIRQPPILEPYLSAQQFKPLISKDGLIVANGTSNTDSEGRPVAGNPSYYFFWLDHKGFTLYMEMQTMDQLLKLKKLGAKYFIFEKSFIQTNPVFYKEVLSNFHVIGETKSAIIVQL